MGFSLAALCLYPVHTKSDENDLNTILVLSDLVLLTVV